MSIRQLAHTTAWTTFPPFSLELKKNQENKNKRNRDRKRRKVDFLSNMTICFSLQFGLFVDRRVRSFIFPVLAFILLYSKLPHKVFQLESEICGLFVPVFKLKHVCNIILMYIAGASLYYKFSSNI